MGGPGKGKIQRFIRAVRGILGDSRVYNVEPKPHNLEPGGGTPPLDAWPLLKLAFLKGLRTPKFIVLEPTSVEEVLDVVRAAREYGVCLHPWSAGSGVLGASLPSRECVVVSVARLKEVSIDVSRMIAHVGAGTRISEIANASLKAGLYFPLLPQSFELASAAGIVSTLGSGLLQPGTGNVEDVVQYIDIVTSGTELIRLGTDVTPRGCIGPCLHYLILGAEGSAGVIVGVGFRLRMKPRGEARVACRLPNLSKAIEIARELSQWNSPHMLRILDENESTITLSTEGPLLLAMYLTSTTYFSSVLKEAVSKACIEYGGEVLEDKIIDRFVRERYRFRERLEELYRAGLWADTIDLAAPWSLMEKTWTILKERLSSIEGVIAVLGHASHFYPSGGSLYLIVVGEASLKVFGKVWKEAMKTALELGVAVTHHHGVGRGKLLWAEKQMSRGGFKTLCSLLDAMDPYRVFRGSPLRRECLRVLEG